MMDPTPSSPHGTCGARHQDFVKTAGRAGSARASAPRAAAHARGRRATSRPRRRAARRERRRGRRRARRAAPPPAPADRRRALDDADVKDGAGRKRGEAPSARRPGRACARASPPASSGCRLRAAAPLALDRRQRKPLAAVGDHLARRPSARERSASAAAADPASTATGPPTPAQAHARPFGAAASAAANIIATARAWRVTRRCRASRASADGPAEEGRRLHAHVIGQTRGG